MVSSDDCQEGVEERMMGLEMMRKEEEEGEGKEISV